MKKYMISLLALMLLSGCYTIIKPPIGDYQNENIIDDNKKNVRLDEDKPFPQFNLNVSNPISWKLMLLIMLI